MNHIAIAARVPEAARAAARLSWVRSVIGDDALELAPASADAGARSYWRTTSADGSRIVMDSPPGLEDVRPWLALRELLSRGGVRVPQVLAEEIDSGFLLLEDLGGPTCLQIADKDNADALFEAALAQLLTLQRIAVAPNFPAYDRALLQRELDLFTEWYLGRHLGVVLDQDEQAQWGAICDTLVGSALAQPQVLVHRDFMLRNLMPDRAGSGGVVVLDFQDAVLGPVTYDIISLCRDAFHSWSPGRVDRWLSLYHAAALDAGIPVQPDILRFRRDADLVGVQRHLKILGIFARLNYRDRKPKYLADADRFLVYLRQVLPAHPQLAALSALLDRHAPRIL